MRRMRSSWPGDDWEALAPVHYRLMGLWGRIHPRTIMNYMEEFYPKYYRRNLVRQGLFSGEMIEHWRRKRKQMLRANPAATTSGEAN